MRFPGAMTTAEILAACAQEFRDMGRPLVAEVLQERADRFVPPAVTGDAFANGQIAMLRRINAATEQTMCRTCGHDMHLNACPIINNQRNVDGWDGGWSCGCPQRGPL